MKPTVLITSEVSLEPSGASFCSTGVSDAGTSLFNEEKNTRAAEKIHDVRRLGRNNKGLVWWCENEREAETCLVNINTDSIL